MEDIQAMEWDIELNAAFAKWFNPLERDVQDEILATLSVMCEVGPDVVHRRLESIKLLATNAVPIKELPEKFQPTTLTEYIKKIPKARRDKIKTRAAEIQAEELQSER